MGDLNSGAVASAVIADLIKSFFTSFGNKSLDIVNGTYSYLFEDFSDYLKKTYIKCNQLKLIINKGQHHTLDEIYVNSKFKCGNNILYDQEIIQRARDCERIVVTGFGGIGKTIFSKKLWSTIFLEPQGKIPIFFELRQLNTMSNINLLAYLRISISSFSQSLDENTFNKFVMDGRFIFIFDGFDELPESIRGEVEKQILLIASDCPKCGLIVSGRFDDRFDSWEQFQVYKALPFEKNQVISLLDKIDYEKRVKSKFISEIVEKRFNDYESFLETPLLALMMLMTFSQSGEVPDNRSVFYKYAFLALYSWHDGSKEAFKRETKTNLNMTQFEKVFSIFCLLSYIDYKYQISHSEFINTIEKCKNYTDFDFDSQKFLVEVVESVNLMYKEGDVYVFTHRSFQEYFTAFACVNYFQSKLVELSSRLYRGEDAVFPLMTEINVDVVDEYLVAKEGGETLSELRHLTKIRKKSLFFENCEIICLSQFLVKSKKTQELINIPIVKHRQYPIWSKLIQLKKGEYIVETGKPHYFSTPIPIKVNESFLKTVISAIGKIDFKKESLVSFVYVAWENRLYYSIDELNTDIITNIISNYTNFPFVRVADVPEEWSTALMQDVKSFLVFSKKQIEEAKKRVRNREKSIDEILG